MNADTSKLIITIISTFAGVLIGVFKDEIKNLFLSSKKYAYLKGKWACKWKENPSVKFPNGKDIFDNIEIKAISGRILKGEGNTKGVGSWMFKGNIADSTLTITYKNVKGSDRSGVIILKLDQDDEAVLEGVWSQHRSGEIVVGTTTWNKIVS